MPGVMLACYYHAKRNARMLLLTMPSVMLACYYDLLLHIEAWRQESQYHIAAFLEPRQSVQQHPNGMSIAAKNVSMSILPIRLSISIE